MSATQSHIVGPKENYPHTHTIILLHGRDSTAKEFADEFFECEATTNFRHPHVDKRLLTDLFPTVRWVFPQAETLPSERFGTVISQWFDMWTTENPQERPELQLPGLRRSVETILKIIAEEELILPRDRIVLGGVSQGFATALAALFADGTGGFAGLYGFSSWFPLADLAPSKKDIAEMGAIEALGALQKLYSSEDEKRTKERMALHESKATELFKTYIYLQHCEDDGVISVQHGHRMLDVLLRLGFRKASWTQYAEGGHWINESVDLNDPEDFAVMLNGVDRFVQWLRLMLDYWVVKDVVNRQKRMERSGPVPK